MKEITMFLIYLMLTPALQASEKPEQLNMGCSAKDFLCHPVLNSEVKVPVQVPTMHVSKVDLIPLFPACVKGKNYEEQKGCTNTQIQNFINGNFNMKVPEKLKLKGTNHIKVTFEINTFGDITNVNATGPHPDVEKEAIRTLSKLPTMIPGKHEGKAVNVSYIVPIMFMFAD